MTCAQLKQFDITHKFGYVHSAVGSGNEDDEPRLGHHAEAGQRQTEVEELRCCPLCRLAGRVVTIMIQRYDSEKKSV